MAVLQLSGFYSLFQSQVKVESADLQAGGFLSRPLIHAHKDCHLATCGVHFYHEEHHKVFLRRKVGAVKQFNVHVQAHRGASSELPENTVASVLRAIEIGADSVEIDIQLLNDNRFLVVHDFQVEESWVSDLSSHDLKAQKYPLLENIFDSLKGLSLSQKVFLDVEIKRDPHSPTSPLPQQIAEFFVETIKKNIPAIPVVVRSFDWAVLRQIRKISPQQALTPLMAHDVSKLEEAIELSSEWIAAPKEILDNQKIAQIQSANRKVMVYTVNQMADWKKWIEQGVDGITTDYPRELLNMLNRPFSQ